MAVVGLVDAELGLHGQAGEADLAAEDAVAGRAAEVDVGQLDGVGVGHGEGAEPAGDGRHRAALLLGRPQLLGDRLDHFGIGHGRS